MWQLTEADNMAEFFLPVFASCILPASLEHEFLTHLPMSYKLVHILSIG